MFGSVKITHMPGAININSTYKYQIKISISLCNCLLSVTVLKKNSDFNDIEGVLCHVAQLSMSSQFLMNWEQK